MSEEKKFPPRGHFGWHTLVGPGEIITGKDSNWPTTILIEAAGEQWKFLPDPHGAMPDLVRAYPPTPQTEEGSY